MEKKETDLLDHLKQALSHLDAALHVTILSLKENPNSKTMIGKVWEEFLGIFFGKVRAAGKENRINLLSMISFPKLRKF
jgi:hypothetical protein